MRPLPALLWLCALAGPVAADGAPYRLYWSYPADDNVAIEIDDADAHTSRFASRWRLALDLKGCAAGDDERRPPSGALVVHRDREVRIEILDAAGAARSSRRCAASLARWKKRLGDDLTERLENELDAHASFLNPRRRPDVPIGPPPTEGSEE